MHVLLYHDMKPRTQVFLRCSSATNANNVRTAVAGFLTGKDVFAQDTPPTTTPVDDAVSGVTLDVRFNNQVDADLLQTQIVTNWASNTRVLAGSRVQTHQCRHDEGIGFCTVDAVAVK